MKRRQNESAHHHCRFSDRQYDSMSEGPSHSAFRSRGPRSARCGYLLRRNVSNRGRCGVVAGMGSASPTHLRRGRCVGLRLFGVAGSEHSLGSDLIGSGVCFTWNEDAVGPTHHEKTRMDSTSWQKAYARSWGSRSPIRRTILAFAAILAGSAWYPADYPPQPGGVAYSRSVAGGSSRRGRERAARARRRKLFRASTSSRPEHRGFAIWK